ncbi:MAG: bactofilin family protein [Bacillota bacterium]
MFGQKKEKGDNKNMNNDKMETVLGEGTDINGNINTKGSLRIEGKFEGEIKAEGDLYVGESGLVDSEVKAKKVVIAGEIKGNITATEKIELLSKGKIRGNIVTDILKVEEGATFIGSSKKINDEDKGKIKTNFKNINDNNESENNLEKKDEKK